MLPPPTVRSTTTSRPAPFPGRLTTGWRTAFAISWGAIFLSFAAIWEASRELGLPTWWLGPASGPQPFVIQILPFLLPALAASCAAWNTRRLPSLGVVAAVVTLAIAAGDLGDITRLALVEGALGLAGLATSVAAATGLVAAAGEPVHAIDLDEVAGPTAR